MKIAKLMLSAFVAAMALVSCNKEAHTPEDSSLKTVEISLKNIIMTKGLAGDPIRPDANGKMPAVQVNNFKVFLTDNSYSPGYSAKNADGTQDATFYFSSAADLDEVMQFHYVDHRCTKVVVVANMGNVELEDVMEIATPIANQQSQAGLILYGEKNLSSAGRQHTNIETGKITDVYTAKVTLAPTISRFEVDGFKVAFSSPNPNFNSIKVTDVAFQHYFPTLGANTQNGLYIGGVGAHHNHIATEDLDNEAVVHEWFNGNASSGWFRDHFATPIEMTPADPIADAPNALAYHFFAGEAVPVMIIKLLADGLPAYVYTGSYKTSSGYLSRIEPGKIYRMSAAGEVASDGTVIIPDDLDPIRRCLEVEVEVVDWAVELITPEF